MLVRSLRDLRDLGCELGIATGRPAREAQRALREFGMRELFSSAHIATYDEVEQAQRLTGNPSLGKRIRLLSARAVS
jgi:phosphoglycolate phosphatase-like HAD superfamily hydrolase